MPVETWVFIGRAFSRKEGKVYFAYVPVDQLEGTELRSKWYAKAAANVSVGQAFDIDVDREGDVSRISLGSGTYNKGASDTLRRTHAEVIAEWETADRAANSAMRAVKLAKSDTASELDERLIPIRKAYHKAVGAERNAILAHVIAFITSTRNT